MTKVFLVGSLKTDVITDLKFFATTQGIATGFGRTFELNGSYYQITANKKLVIVNFEIVNGTAGGGCGLSYATESGYKDSTTFAGIVNIITYAVPTLTANEKYNIPCPITIPADATGFYPLVHARAGSGYYHITAYETD
jgi:hypothetical protein